MIRTKTPEPAWKRILILMLWLYLMTPVGLWKLWQDEVLNPSAKWRLLIYGFLIPTLIYATFAIFATNHTLQRFLP